MACRDLFLELCMLHCPTLCSIARGQHKSLHILEDLKPKFKIF
jgi:hypothetical protein